MKRRGVILLFVLGLMCTLAGAVPLLMASPVLVFGKWATGTIAAVDQLAEPKEYRVWVEFATAAGDKIRAKVELADRRRVRRLVPGEQVDLVYAIHQPDRVELFSPQVFWYHGWLWLVPGLFMLYLGKEALDSRRAKPDGVVAKAGGGRRHSLGIGPFVWWLAACASLAQVEAKTLYVSAVDERGACVEIRKLEVKLGGRTVPNPPDVQAQLDRNHRFASRPEECGPLVLRGLEAGAYQIKMRAWLHHQADSPATVLLGEAPDGLLDGEEAHIEVLMLTSTPMVRWLPEQSAGIATVYIGETVAARKWVRVVAVRGQKYVERMTDEKGRLATRDLRRGVYLVVLASGEDVFSGVLEKVEAREDTKVVLQLVKREKP